MTAGSQIGPPALLAATPADCYVVAAGGHLGGAPVEALLVALSADTLYVRGEPAASHRDGGLVAKPLPGGRR